MTQIKEKLITPSFIFSFIGSFMLFFAFYLILPILPLYLKDTYQASDSLIGIILASYTITALLIRPFGGYLVDMFARKPFLIFCYFTFIAFFAGYMVASSLMLFAILRATHGLSFGLITISNSTVAIDIMPASRRNDGIGYFGVSVNLAMALGPMAALYIYELYDSYYYVFLASFIAGVIGMLAVLFIRISKKEHTKTPKEKEPVSLDRFFLIKGLSGAIALALMSFSYGLLSTYVAVYARDEVGISSGAGMFFIAMAGGLIFSRLLTAKMMYRGDLNRIIYIGNIIMIVSLLIFILLKQPLFFYLSAATVGIAFGYVAPAFQAMFINLAHHNQRGTANSTYYISYDMGIGLGVLIGGQIAEMSNYTAAYTAGLILVVISFFVFHFVAAPYYTKHRLR